MAIGAVFGYFDPVIDSNNVVARNLDGCDQAKYGIAEGKYDECRQRTEGCEECPKGFVGYIADDKENTNQIIDDVEQLGVGANGFVFEVFGIEQQGFYGSQNGLNKEDDGDNDVSINQFLEWGNEGCEIMENKGEAIFCYQCRNYVRKVFENAHFNENIVVGIVTSFGVTGNDFKDDVSRDVIDDRNHED